MHIKILHAIFVEFLKVLTFQPVKHIQDFSEELLRAWARQIYFKLCSVFCVSTLSTTKLTSL